MTPNDIEILIHYYVSPAEHPRRGAPAVEEAIKRFVKESIFIPATDFYGSFVLLPNSRKFIVTNRGRALVGLLCQTPYPKQAWIDPRTDDLIYDI